MARAKAAGHDPASADRQCCRLDRFRSLEQCFHLSDGQPWASGSTGGATALEDVGPVCPVPVTAALAPQDIRDLIVVVPMQAGPLHDFLQIAICVARLRGLGLGCGARGLGLFRWPRCSQNPALDQSRCCNRRWLWCGQRIPYLAALICLLQPTGNCIGIVLIGTSVLLGIARAPEPRVDFGDHRFTRGRGPPIEGPEVEFRASRAASGASAFRPSSRRRCRHSHAARNRHRCAADQ